MNTYQVLQRKDGKWDFTVTNDSITQPVGYCAPYREVAKVSLVNQRWYEDYLAEKDKYHGHGHDTKEEAAECYRQYLLDRKLHLMMAYIDEQKKCEVCRQWTGLYASCDMLNWTLCQDHNNRAEVERLFKLSADSVIWSSW